MRFAAESPAIRSARELLNVGPLASPEELKKAYHRLALLYHPDRNPDLQSGLVFDQIKKAFDTLKDPILVKALNQKHLQGHLSRVVHDGLEVTFGSFFGYRLFRLPGLIERRFRLGKEKASEKDQIPMDAATQVEGTSILDSAAYDSLELVFAGKFSKDDGQELLESFRSQSLLALPWVTLNHRGIYHFMADELSESLECYETLNQRIPGNIIFMYRLGLLEILLAFRLSKPTLLRGQRPDSKRLKKGITLLEHCLKLASTRPVGRQRCLTIRKTLAEVLEKSGQRIKAQGLWKEIIALDPKSVEAAFRRGGYSAAAALLDSKRRSENPKKSS